MNHDLELYKVFHIVARCHNISHAAEMLYISQPAVSNAIKKLERELGTPLFSRSSKGVELTTEGRLFHEYIEKALGIIMEGEDVLTQLKNKEKGTITIGVSTTLCKHFLFPYLKPFIAEYPEIQIKIINKSTFDTLKQIDQGLIDFGIVSRPANIELYEFTKLADIDDVFVANQDYLTSKNISEPNEIFTKCPFMMMEPDNITRQYIDRFFEENGIVVKPEIEINNMDFLIEFAKIGLGVTVVIKNFIEAELAAGELVSIPVSPSIPPRTVGIIRNKKTSLSIAAETFLSYLQPFFHAKNNQNRFEHR